MAAPLDLLPAVDVRLGRTRRLPGGGAGERDVGDPLEVALAWQAGGARWVHLVDVDAAFGTGTNAALLAEVVGRLDVDVEVAGGIVDDTSLDAALATGCRRVVIGAAALSDPGWCRRAIARHGDRVAVGLDVLGTRIAPRGTVHRFGQLDAVLDELEREGCPRYVVTDVDREAALEGPNLALLDQVARSVSAPVVASGGVRDLSDLVALRRLDGIEGVIVGSALHDGRLPLDDAVAACTAGGTDA